MHVEVRPGQTENYWRTYILSREKEIGLHDVAVAPQPFYLRIWLGGTVVSIWPDAKSLQGSLTKWVKEAVPPDEVETGRYFILNEALDSAVCRKLYLAYQSRQLSALPSEERIPGWQQGFDGVTYLLETVAYDAYSLKTYWTPEVQKEVKEAALVQDFVDTVGQLLDLKKRSYYFGESIPFESWTTASGSSASRILTLAEHYRMNKERSRYRWLVRRQKLKK